MDRGLFVPVRMLPWLPALLQVQALPWLPVPVLQAPPLSKGRTIDLFSPSEPCR